MAALLHILGPCRIEMDGKSKIPKFRQPGRDLAPALIFNAQIQVVQYGVGESRSSSQIYSELFGRLYLFSLLSGGIGLAGLNLLRDWTGGYTAPL